MAETISIPPLNVPIPPLEQIIDRKQMGRPPHKPTPEMRATCRGLAATGMGKRTISVMLAMLYNWKKPLDDKTLMKRYGEDIEYGRSRMMTGVGMAWQRLIAQGDLGAIKWAQTTYGGEEFRQRKDDGAEVDPERALMGDRNQQQPGSMQPPIEGEATVIGNASVVQSAEDAMRDYLGMMRPKALPAPSEQP